MKNIINLIVNDSNKNQRVDVFINKCENSLSRTRIKNLILKKKLKINDIVSEDPSKKMIVGDKIELDIPEPKKASLKPYDYKLDIVFEDNDLLIINKSIELFSPERGFFNSCDTSAANCSISLILFFKFFNSKNVRTI